MFPNTIKTLQSFPTNQTQQTARNHSLRCISFENLLCQKHRFQPPERCLINSVFQFDEQSVFRSTKTMRGFSRYVSDMFLAQQLIKQKKVIAKMWNMTPLSDLFSSTFVQYGVVVVHKHDEVVFNEWFAIVMPQSQKSNTIPIEYTWKVEDEDFHSKILGSFVLPNEDLSENKETFHIDSSSHHITNSPDNHFQIQQKESRRQVAPKHKLLPQFSRDFKPKELKQKQNRNIFSNVLRIFMKNVLEMGIYEDTIRRIIGKHSLALSPDDFYRWLDSFKINFKNYIRFKQLANLFCSQHTIHHQKILIILLRSFLNTYCTTHSLTSRKINAKGRKAHISGIRLLRQALHHLRPIQT